MEMKELLKQGIAEALDKAIAAGTLPAGDYPAISLEVPPQKEFGDFATNIAMQSARIARRAPKMIAEAIVAQMDYPWLAFIPYARTWFQGELCGTLHFGHKELKSPGIWLLVIPVVGGIVTGLFSIFIWGGLALQITEMVTSVTATTYSDAYYSYQGGASVGGFLMMLVGILLFALVSLAVSAVSGALEVLVNRQIFARYAPDNNALLHAVMGIFLPLYTSIYFFLIRNRERGPQPGPGGFPPQGGREFQTGATEE